MTSLLKLVFDECVPRQSMVAMAGYLLNSQSPPQVKHIVEFQGQGIADSVWIPQYAADGWVAITADRARRGTGGPAEKLPLLCHRHRMTHVVLSNKMHHCKVFEKCQYLLRVWNDIVTLPDQPPGSRYVLRFTHGDSVRLEKIELQPDGRRMRRSKAAKPEVDT